MVGVLLKICSVYYYLCPSCTCLKVWDADGLDLCPWLLGVNGSTGDVVPCKCHCHPEMIKKPSSSSVGNKNSSKCVVCGSRNVCPRGSMVLLDPCTRSVRRVNLCGKHAPPEQILGMATCLQEFEEIVKDYCISKQSSKRVKRSAF
jgi:hypothetical protein